jgi:hypothetical protein
VSEVEKGSVLKLDCVAAIPFDKPFIVAAVMHTPLLIYVSSLTSDTCVLFLKCSLPRFHSLFILLPCSPALSTAVARAFKLSVEEGWNLSLDTADTYKHKS